MRPVDLIVRLEWAAVTVAAIVAYWLSGGSWLLFAVLILAPDLSMLGYLAGPRVGAYAYNAVHVLFWPVVLILLGLLMSERWVLLHVGLIWLAHIAIDRALGYGLKLPTGFQDTHLGRIGRG
jgi:hypothetical protein